MFSWPVGLAATPSALGFQDSGSDPHNSSNTTVLITMEHNRESIVYLSLLLLHRTRTKCGCSLEGCQEKVGTNLAVLTCLWVSSFSKAGVLLLSSPSSPSLCFTWALAEEKMPCGTDATGQGLSWNNLTSAHVWRRPEKSKGEMRKICKTKLRMTAPLHSQFCENCPLKTPTTAYLLFTCCSVLGSQTTDTPTVPTSSPSLKLLLRQG